MTSPEFPSRPSSTDRAARTSKVELTLPQGVTPAAWAWERQTHQNARLRTLIGCLELLERLDETDFAILNASARRLLELREGLRQVGSTLLGELPRHLDEESVVPALEVVRCELRLGLHVLRETALDRLEALGQGLRDQDLERLRRGLCEVRHEIEAFLRESFGRLVAADPRSRHDVDYFLSRRFARDLVDSERLLMAIGTLLDELAPLAHRRVEDFFEKAQDLRRFRRVAPRQEWSTSVGLLVAIDHQIVPRLRALLSFGGVRLDEAQKLEEYASRLPVLTGLADRLLKVGNRLGPIEDARGALQEAHWVLAEQLAAVLAELDEALHDLELFVKHWVEAVSDRRALRLRRD